MTLPEDKTMISFVMLKSQKDTAEKVARLSGYTFSSFIRKSIINAINELDEYHSSPIKNEYETPSLLMQKIKSAIKSRE